MTEDVPFYVELARESDGPLVELAVGNGRVAIPVAREAIRRMSPRHGGSGGAIVNLSSAAVWLGAPNDFVWYAASKGAVMSMTRVLAIEYARRNIRVNAINPGVIGSTVFPQRYDAKSEPGSSSTRVSWSPASSAAAASSQYCGMASGRCRFSP